MSRELTMDVLVTLLKRLDEVQKACHRANDWTALNELFEQFDEKEASKIELLAWLRYTTGSRRHNPGPWNELRDRVRVELKRRREDFRHLMQGLL